MSDLLLQNAQTAYRSGNIADAARLYHEILRTEPRHFDALSTLGLIYFRAGQFDPAQYLIGEAVKLDPLYLDGLCVRGVALANLKRHQDALACFERALAIKPDFVEALSNHAATLQELNRHEEALAEFDRALGIDPFHAISWSNRGNALVALKRHAEGVESYDRALAIDPEFPHARENRLHALGELNRGGPAFADVLCLQASEFMRRQRWPEALARFDEAIAVRPDFADALTGRATVLLEMKQPEDALEVFDAALKADPNHAIAWNNRGNALTALKRFEEAVECYDKALAIQPDLLEARENRDNALFELKRGTRCPPGYMRILFDDFCSHYDDTMLSKLQYRAHIHLRTLAERVLPRLTPPWRILDLGCGTGLVGDTFYGLAAGGRMDGIDLSPHMVESTRGRGMYDEVVLGDLETELALPGRSYELILAADTMIYLGELSIALDGVAKRLEPGGFYLFAVESMDGEGWEQTDMHRFRHSESYLRREAERAGLVFVELMECTLRYESSQAVMGFAVALRKPSAQ